MATSIQFIAVAKYLQSLLGWLVVVSFFTFVLSLIVIPWIVGRLPRHCFLKFHHQDQSKAPPSFGSVTMAICRNIFGLLLILAGIAMLFLPGQGLLTILLGSLLISFPGKQKLIYSLICQPKIQKSLDWLRKIRGKPVFLWPEPEVDSEKD